MITRETCTPWAVSTFFKNKEYRTDPVGESIKKIVSIMGPRRMQNELIASLLDREMNLVCRIGELPSAKNEGRFNKTLVLYDCLGKEPEDCLEELISLTGRDLSDFLVALFNVSPDTESEEKAVGRGVRGVFHEQDPLPRFLKGIKAIFNNELWVSRDILTKLVLNKGHDNKVKTGGAPLLTPRETEILTMISAGANNEKIAERLYISPNTVKTHIYNIFKKINVPNRLQAALWAAKHL